MGGRQTTNASLPGASRTAVIWSRLQIMPGRRAFLRRRHVSAAAAGGVRDRLIAARLTRVRVVRPLKAGPTGELAATERYRVAGGRSGTDGIEPLAKTPAPARCVRTRLPAPLCLRPAQSLCPSWIRTIAATTVIRNAQPPRSPGTVPCPAAPGADGAGQRARDARSRTCPANWSGPGKTCGGYSGYGEDTAADNVSSPKPRTCRGYSEDAQKMGWR
jgi:hypothetical protein